MNVDYGLVTGVCGIAEERQNLGLLIDGDTPIALCSFDRSIRARRALESANVGELSSPYGVLPRELRQKRDGFVFYVERDRKVRWWASYWGISARRCVCTLENAADRSC